MKSLNLEELKNQIDKEKKYWKSYGVFAIALQLKNQSYHGIDQWWQDAIDLYEEFLNSEYNDLNKSELECINKFIIELN